MDPQLDETINTIVRVLKNSKSVLFVTGAGISADSGVPTYRGVGGMYDVDVTEDGIPIEQALSGGMIRLNPELTWKYLAQIADACRGATFNRAHEVIALLEAQIPRVWTLTQNVDGFHRHAGSTNVIEIHGNMRSLHCTQCSHREEIQPDDNRAMPPYCEKCEAIMRPNVVLFDELLPKDAISTLESELETGFDAMFSIGTSGSFPYIRGPFAMAPRDRTVTAEINPDATTITPLVDYYLPMSAAAAMDRVWNRLTATP